MQKKIYVVGMFDDGTACKVQDAVSAVAGFTLPLHQTQMRPERPLPNPQYP